MTKSSPTSDLRPLTSPFSLGDWRLDVVSGGRLWLDGGTMFGVAPRAAWERKMAPDEQNRIALDTNCLLARDGKQTILFDTGYGGKKSARRRETMAIKPGEPLLESLAAIGVAPEAIDLVVFTHLHFDHAGGATRRDTTGKLVPTFPNASYVVGRTEWEDSLSDAPELTQAYPEDLTPLQETGRLRLVEDQEEIVPGLTAIHTGGHTRGHQALLLTSQGQTAFYPGDLCPTTNHMRILWGMSYDTFPLDTRRRKPELLGRAADENWIVFWDHDPKIRAGRIGRHEKKQFVVTETLA